MITITLSLFIRLLKNNNYKDPAQYTLRILNTPSANKQGELRQLKQMVIEIGSCLTNHNSSYLEFKNLQVRFNKIT